MGIFNYQVRVYYDSTDAGGVVYHSRYMDFCERARTEFLRSKDIIQSKLREESGIGFVVHKATLEYKKSAQLDDLLNITTKIISSSAITLTMEQNIFVTSRKNEDVNNQLLFHLIIDIVCINSNFKPTRIPKDIFDKLIK